MTFIRLSIRKFWLNELSAVIWAIVFTCGCSVTDSSDIKSQGVFASNSVTAKSGVAVCKSTLQVGGSTGTYIELDGGDQLLCNGVTMTKSHDLLNQTWYEATVPYLPGTGYQISFVRADGTSMSANMKLPSEIKNAQIENGTTLTVGKPFAITWLKSADASESINGDLILNNQHQDQAKLVSLSDGGPESGRMSFSPSDTDMTQLNEQTSAEEHVPGPYSGRVILTRSVAGSLTGVWSGTADGNQKVELKVSVQESQ